MELLRYIERENLLSSSFNLFRLSLYIIFAPHKHTYVVRLQICWWIFGNNFIADSSIHQNLCRTQWLRVGNNVDFRDNRAFYGFMTQALRLHDPHKTL